MASQSASPSLGQAQTSSAGFPKETLLGVLWGGVSISLAFVLFRAYVRLRFFRKFSIDDYSLALAWLISLSNAIIWQIRVPDLYFGIEISSGRITSLPTDLNALGAQLNRYLRSILVSYIIQYSGLWCVKFTLLFFFRGLGDKVKRQAIIWWIVCVFIVASFIVCLGTIDYGCLTSSFPEIIGKCTTTGVNKFEKTTLSLTTALDILTDTSIIILSTNILWQIRISLRRKLALAGIFSLTIFVIAVAIVRVVVSLKGNLIDLSYIFTWGGVELSVAVIIACLASFRTLYTATKTEKTQESSGHKTTTVFSKRSGAYNNISDDIPLHTGTLRHTTEISNGSEGWDSDAHANHLKTSDPHKVYVRQDYGVHTV